jgi:hypothetical protein
MTGGEILAAVVVVVVLVIGIAVVEDVASRREGFN